jgi:predicted PurR-regulated permease PerM
MNQPAPNSAQSIRGHIVFAFALAIALYIGWLLRSLLLLIYVSALFAVILSPVVRATSRLRIGRRYPFEGSSAILLLLVVVAAALIGFGFLALPPVVHDLESVNGEMPKRIPDLLARLKQIPFADRLDSGQIIGWIQGSLSQAAAMALHSLTDWAGALINVVAGLVLTLYFILEGESAYRWFLSFLSPQPRQRLDNALQRAALRMEKWLVGQAALMLILGTASTIVYASLGVRYAYGLGVLTGLLNLVPILGVVVSGALALLVAAVDSWGRVLGVVIFFAIWVQLESSLLIPRIMKSRVDLSGLAIFVALLLGSELGGIPGAMVAIPTAVLVVVLLDEYLVRKDTA